MGTWHVRPFFRRHVRPTDWMGHARPNRHVRLSFSTCSRHVRLGSSSCISSSSGSSTSSSNSSIRLGKVTHHLRFLLEDRLVRREVVVMVIVQWKHIYRDLL